MASPETTLNEALAMHQRGRLDEASILYQTVLRQQPGNLEALHLLGMAALQSRRTRHGIGLLREAILLHPAIPAIHITLATGSAIWDVPATRWSALTPRSRWHRTMRRPGITAATP